MATTGKIGVTTENIFPVIKKFLYSDHEIFLRELVANAVDATQKMKALAASGEYAAELGDLAVRIELDEAAKIDGCGFVGIFAKIIFPLLKPILATIAILTFQGSWNDYLSPLIFTMSKPEQRTLIVGIVQLKSTGEAAASWNLMLAGTTIALIPVLIAYIFANRYFVEGIAAGAVKG